MDKDTLKEAKDAFKLASDAEKDQRIQSLDDLRFAKLGEQWPEQVKKAREVEGRPCLTHNRMPSFTKQVLNDARQNRPAMKFHPVGDGATQETAEILDGLARNIEYTSNADIAYDTALDFAVNTGLGYWVIRTDYAHEDTFDLDIMIERIANPFSVYGDPHSTAADSSDWNSAFITDLLDKTEFQRRWPKADTSDFTSDGKTSKDVLWFHGDQIQVAEWWKRDQVASKILKLSNGSIMTEDELMTVGDDGFTLMDILMSQGIVVSGDRTVMRHRVTQYILNGSEILETNPWKGRYIPIVPVYGEEVNVEGKRYFHSLIHFAKDSQRQYNFWRTASTELVALAPKAPFIGAVGAFATDHQKWENANNVSYSNIEYDPVEGQPPPQRQAFAGPPAGALQEALNASDDMKAIIGLHDASLGAQGNETSGRAILARQREGDVSTFNFVDNLSRAIRHSGRIIMDLIPHVYSAARVIRCIKEDGSNFAVPVNQPVIPQQQGGMPPADPMQAGPMGQGPMGPQPPMPMGGQAPMAGQMPAPMAGPMPQPPMMPGSTQGPMAAPQFTPAPPGADQDPMMAGLVKVFDLSAGKYDVTVEAGPSFTTRREEAASQMLELLRVMPQAAPLLADLLAKNLDWPSADEIAKRMQAMLPPQIQGQNPQIAHLSQMLQQQHGAAMQAVTTLKQQLADKSGDMQIRQYEAVNGRIQALATAVKDGVQLTQDAEGNLQAIPLMKPQQPSPDTVIDAGLRQRDQQLEAAHLVLQADKQSSDHSLGHAQAFTDHARAQTEHMQAAHQVSQPPAQPQIQQPAQ
jgi:hypothetical protein